MIRERPTPVPARRRNPHRDRACAVCRTDLHVVDGELPDVKFPIIPGHQIVGLVAACGADVSGPAIGARVGVPWLGRDLGGVCPYCRDGRENLWTGRSSLATPATVGLPTHTVADARYCFTLPKDACRRACAAHVRRTNRLAQLPDGRRRRSEPRHVRLRHGGPPARPGRGSPRPRVYAFTRPGDTNAQHFARTSVRCGPAT